jgi:type III pantothenate kinase
MLVLVIDVGNTNIKLGVYRENDLLASWRVQTHVGRTADEYGLILRDLFSRDKLALSDVEGIVMSSVLPSLNYTIGHMCRYFFGQEPLLIGPGVKTSLNIKYDNPKEVGADRIVNCVAAHTLYGGPAIVVDFGTATTFSVVSKDCDFIGGVICPGIKTSADALTQSAAKLPKFELQKPERVIGKSTVTNMQSGIVNGFTGMVSYILQKIREELGEPAKAIATGGLGQLMFPEERLFDVVDRKLTLTGLKLVYDLNADKRRSFTTQTGEKT